MDIKIDLSKAHIETDRLILRSWKKSDYYDFYEYARVEGVGEMAGWNHHSSPEESKEILKIFRKEKNTLAIVFKENNKVIGSIGLHNSWTNNDDRYRMLIIKELGYALSKSYWGKGIATEASMALIQYAFNNYPLEALSCCHFIDNRQSMRVIEKCGFTYTGEGEYYSQQMNKIFPTKNYILYKPEK